MFKIIIVIIIVFGALLLVAILKRDPVKEVAKKLEDANVLKKSVQGLTNSVQEPKEEEKPSEVQK